MTASFFKVFGEIAGIGGLSLAVFLTLFRDIIRRNIFANLGREYSYLLMKQIIWAVWSIAAIGLVLWFLGSLKLTFGPNSPIING